jgi:hypothetical protein
VTPTVWSGCGDPATGTLLRELFQRAERPVVSLTFVNFVNQSLAVASLVRYAIGDNDRTLRLCLILLCAGFICSVVLREVVRR